ncbi:oxysterol-binding protein-related protein 9 isoform X2 [Anabrus simplex]|uniref:oxysterol-binding protein-related protein 9 isoform X2 n=1 Tax=Anabrus simplex TaxID=316456 RepID=UPI0034DD611C
MAAMEGSLSKWTNVMKGWQFRWFVLDDNAGLLSYYTSRDKMIRGVRRGCVRLKGAVIGIDDEDDSTFTITVDGKTFHFQSRDAEERERWIRALEDTILRHASRARFDPNLPLPTMSDFEKKLQETDAYLQIIIDQVKALEKRILIVSDPTEKGRLEVIHREAEVLLENVKHAIVMLQIAKNTAHPVGGVYTGPTNITPQGNVTTSKTTSHETSELGKTSTGHRPSMTLIVPETSYSSSEEEDFFDANEYSDTPSVTQSPTGLRPFLEAAPAEEPAEGNAAALPSNSETPGAAGSVRPAPICPDGSLDYDAIYEDGDEHDCVMEQHGSVVAHLLSQVKIGMDLTKVVLPTFILERRSLLEMYADYFAHPDIFVNIADFADPKDRMVQVLRWYMSAYHAGRKSSVAKKPYNPILGEVFQCHWNIPGGDEQQAPLVSDGPVPWCSQNQLTFVAEQVSHHPPISAFYAEHYKKRISFCAHVWTKSKFLGLSIGVHNIGQGCISVLDYDEEYIVTFPNGYGRSILTIPWIELGGSVTITCAKTGYSANVEFHTKPFYGGRKHRVSAEAFQPNEKKPFLVVNGEWNGSMEAKWSDGRVEPFVDVSKLQIVKKIVRPIKEQASNESRRVWMEVTAGLRTADIDRASRAKFNLEHKQREEAKERKEKDLKWTTQLFQEAGGNWIYKNPLVQRLAEHH